MISNREYPKTKISMEVSRGYDSDSVLLTREDGKLRICGSKFSVLGIIAHGTVVFDLKDLEEMFEA